MRLTVNGRAHRLTVEPRDNLLAALSVVALLHSHPAPREVQVAGALADNLCRCGTYPKIRKAIKLAARRARNR